MKHTFKGALANKADRAAPDPQDAEVMKLGAWQCEEDSHHAKTPQDIFLPCHGVTSPSFACAVHEVDMLLYASTAHEAHGSMPFQPAETR